MRHRHPRRRRPSPDRDAHPTATPTVAPTATPTAGTLVVNPGAMSFTAPGQTMTFTVSESAYGGAFTVSSQNTAIATASPATLTPTGVGGMVTFTVTSGTASGNTSITIVGANGKTGSVAVTVTITGGVIS